MLGVREDTKLAYTRAYRISSSSDSANRHLPHNLSRGGLSPRSLVLPLAQHRQPTDPGLAAATTLCRSRAITHFRENSGTSRPSRHTGGLQIHPCDGGGGGLSPALHVPSMICENIDQQNNLTRKREGKEGTPRSRCLSPSSPFLFIYFLFVCFCLLFVRFVGA